VPQQTLFAIATDLCYATIATTSVGLTEDRGNTRSDAWHKSPPTRAQTHAPHVSPPRPDNARLCPTSEVDITGPGPSAPGGAPSRDYPNRPRYLNHTTVGGTTSPEGSVVHGS